MAQHHSNSFILPLKLDDSLIPTHLIYSDIQYKISDAYAHRSTLKKTLAITSEYIHAHESTVSISKVK